MPAVHPAELKPRGARRWLFGGGRLSGRYGMVIAVASTVVVVIWLASLAGLFLKMLPVLAMPETWEFLGGLLRDLFD